MGTEKRYDTAIIGGGPGGSTLAALLAKKGYSSVIVERQEFPRFRIGESLLPFSIDIWRKSGVLEKIQQGPYMVKHGARFVVDETLEEECFWFRNGLDKDHPLAFQVQRAPFDKLLLDHARELGVRVLQPAAAKGIRVSPDEAVLETDYGEIHARVIADVTGRWTFSANQRGGRTLTETHRKISCFAHYTGVKRCEQDEGNIIIVRFGETEKGWFWLIPFQDGATSVGVVADAGFYRQSGLSPAAFLARSLAESRAMAPRMENAKVCGEVQSEADFSYRTRKLVGERLLAVGDAGAFIDPVFSSGVFLSTKAAELAADAIDGAIRANDFSAARFSEYEAKVKRATEVFFAFIDAFYHKDFLKRMVTSRRRPLLQSSITSLLAGDVFNENNALISYLTGEGGAFAADEEARATLG